MAQALIKGNTLKDLVQQDSTKARLKEIMGERAPQFAAALVQLVNQSEQLKKCEPNSIIGCALTAAALEMSIDPNIGEAHIVPYGDKATFQLGFKGFIQLAMRTGEYKTFGSTVVYDGELEHYDELTGELVINKKSRKEGAVIIGYAAKFKLLNGFERGEYWTATEIENHALMYSKQYRYCKGKPDKEANCLWITKRDEMAIKTVEKSLLNHYGPKSVQMRKAIKMDGGAVIDADSEVVAYVDNASAPEFEGPAPVKVEEMKSAKAPESPKEGTSINHLKMVRGLIELAELKEEQVIEFLKSTGVIGEADNTLAEVPQSVLELLAEQHGDIFNRIKTTPK